MRVTDGMVARSLLRDIDRNAEHILSLQTKLGTGREINKPSDNPTGMVASLQYRGEISEIEQYGSNMSSSLEWMNATSVAMGKVEDILFEVNDACASTSTDLATPEQRNSLAVLIDQYLRELIDVANDTSRGRYLFGGTETGTAPFSPDDPDNITSVTQNPDGISSDLNREIGLNQIIKINVNGDSLFQPDGAGDPDTDIFQVLIDLRDALLADDTDAITTGMTRIADVQEHVLETDSILGATIKRVEFSQENLTYEILNKQERLSDVEDTDYTKTIIEYYEAQNMYDTALSVGAQIIQMSIIDYL